MLTLLSCTSCLLPLFHSKLHGPNLIKKKKNKTKYEINLIENHQNRDLMDELVVYIREAVDRKQENMRRRRRRDALRLQLVKVLEKMTDNRVFSASPNVLDRENFSLHPSFVEYMEGARLYLEAETDKDNASMKEVKTHFCDFIRKLIKNFSCELVACGLFI